MLIEFDGPFQILGPAGAGIASVQPGAQVAEAFLQSRIRFPEMAQVVARALETAPTSEPGSVEEVLEADREARRVARAETERLKSEGSGTIA